MRVIDLLLNSNVAQAFYEPFESAKLENISGMNYWTLSCEEEVNITFKIGGKAYPVHPLDATLPFSVVGLDRDDCFGTVCIFDLFFHGEVLNCLIVVSRSN